MIFHLVSRLNGRESLFVPGLREEVAALIRRMIGRTDADLLAYSVMPNHLHVLLRQGRSSLGSVMQPLMRRVALQVHATHGRQGRVFERRYRDRLCASPDHVREALMYVHLNPYRAGLCGRELDHPATTHPAYLAGADPEAYGIDPDVQQVVLQLFDQGEARSRDDLCGDYLGWLDWRLGQESGDAAPAESTGQPDGSPDWRPGNRAWRRHFGPVTRAREHAHEPQLPDLRDFVVNRLGTLGSGSDFNVDQLRGSWLPREAARCRAGLIRAAAVRGYRTGKIADFFRISPASVSTARHAPVQPEGEDADPVSAST